MNWDRKKGEPHIYITTSCLILAGYVVGFATNYNLPIKILILCISCGIAILGAISFKRTIEITKEARE